MHTYLGVTPLDLLLCKHVEGYMWKCLCVTCNKHSCCSCLWLSSLVYWLLRMPEFFSWECSVAIACLAKWELTIFKLREKESENLLSGHSCLTGSSENLLSPQTGNEIEVTQSLVQRPSFLHSSMIASAGCGRRPILICSRDYYRVGKGAWPKQAKMLVRPEFSCLPQQVKGNLLYLTFIGRNII